MLNVRRTPPHVIFSGEFIPIELDENKSNGILIFPDDSIIPEVLEDHLVTPYLSITIMNTNVTGQSPIPPAQRNDGAPTPFVQDDQFLDLNSDIEHGHNTDTSKCTYCTQDIRMEEGWVQIMGARATAPDGTKVIAVIPFIFSLKLAPGQIYPLPIEVELDASSPAPASISIELDLIDLDTKKSFTVYAGEYKFTRKKWGDVYKITFLDYDSIVHYGIFERAELLVATYELKFFKCY